MGCAGNESLGTMPNLKVLNKNKNKNYYNQNNINNNQNYNNQITQNNNNYIYYQNSNINNINSLNKVNNNIIRNQQIINNNNNQYPHFNLINNNINKNNINLMLQKNNTIQNNQNSNLQINNVKNQDQDKKINISYKNDENKKKNGEGVIMEQAYIENIINNEKSFEEYENNRLNLLKIINEKKDMLKNIVHSCPDRNSTILDDMVSYLNEKVQNLSEVEKAYVLFYWEHMNIAYDEIGLNTGNKTYKYEEVYKKGVGVCSGYSRLFNYIGEKIGLKVKCISGFSKDFTTPKGDLGGKHEWNYIYINRNLYFIDCTWGAGYVHDNQYIKEFKEFYFLPSPRSLLFNHLPNNSFFQFLKHPINEHDFSFAKIPSKDFFEIGFIDISKRLDSYICKDNKEKFIFYHNPGEKYEAEISVLDEKLKKFDEKYILIKYEERKIEVDIFFNTKGKFDLKIKITRFTNKYKYAFFNYEIISEQNSNSLLEFSKEEKDDAFCKHLKKCLNLEYTNIKSNRFIVKNIEKLIFKPIVVGVIYCHINNNDNYNKLLKNIFCKRTNKEKNQTEIEIFFNIKMEYNLVIIFKNGFELNLILTCEQDAIQELHHSIEDINRDEFNEVIENSDKLTYLSHKTNSFKVKNKETFIFQAKEKYYLISHNLRLIKDNEENNDINNIYSSIITKERNDETKFELDVIFNYKGKYDLIIILYFEDGKNITLRYFPICENDANPELKFEPNELDRRAFDYTIHKSNFSFLSHKKNCFIAKNRELFIFESEKDLDLDIEYEPSICLVKDDGKYEIAEGAYIIVRPHEKLTKRYEVEVILNYKGKYHIKFPFKNYICYYPVLEQDSNTKIEIEPEISCLYNFNIIMNKYFSKPFYASHSSISFKAKNNEKMIFFTKKINNFEVLLYDPDKKEINTYTYKSIDEENGKKYEIVLYFNKKGKYHLIIIFNREKLDYVPIVNQDSTSEFTIKPEDIGLIPISHKNLNFDVNESNIENFYFKIDDSKNLQYKIFCKKNGKKDKFNILENELYYSIWFKKKGEYYIKIISENKDNKGDAKTLIYIANCLKDSEDELDFISPYTYQDFEEIEIIEPIFNNWLKVGKEVSFKIYSKKFDSIIIDNGDNENMEKNSNNIFEKKITIKSKYLAFMNKIKENTYSYLFKFEIKN